MSTSKDSMNPTPAGSGAEHQPVDDIQFNTDVDIDNDPELERIQRQVDSLHEDVQLKQLQNTAAKDEGTRKTAVPAAGAAGGQPKGNTSVFVNGLDPRTTEDDLRVFFVSSGEVKRLTILQDRNTGRPKGSAYVEFDTPEQAQGALLKDGQSLHGRPLKVAVKRDNVPAFQRGGAMGGRGGAGGFFPGGRGGRGGAAMNAQITAMATMMATMMAGGGAGFSPYGGGAAGGPGAGRGRGRGRGRGGRDSY